MSLNCLTCQVLRRTDSNNGRNHCGKQKDISKFCCISIHRSWSMNMSSAAAYDRQFGGESTMTVVPSKKGHRRLNTIDTTYGAVAFEDDGEPRLVRSCGMRRDWSFENLREVRDEKMRKEMIVR
ncbi:hypothetical protein DITRI_Ditri04bG0091100 [Diplodiscus trichospermus]